MLAICYPNLSLDIYFEVICTGHMISPVYRVCFALIFTQRFFVILGSENSELILRTKTSFTTSKKLTPIY